MADKPEGKTTPTLFVWVTDGGREPTLVHEEAFFMPQIDEVNLYVESGVLVGKVSINFGTPFQLQLGEALIRAIMNRKLVWSALIRQPVMMNAALQISTSQSVDYTKQYLDVNQYKG